MKRTDNLQENSIVTRLKTARLAFDAMKTSQRAGSSNVIARRIVTGNNIDFTTTIAYHQLRIFEVTITPAPGTAPNALFVWKVFYNDITVTGTGTAQVYTDVEPAAPDGTRTSRFYALGTTPSATVTYGVRVAVYAIGNATLSVAQIA